MRSGPAKAASAASGLCLGSTIANVATTSPFIKHTDFTPERAGAVDVISSTNAQLTPPVTGAAAFLICECTGVSYPDLIKHAFLPAVISNIALLDSVHLQALKLGLKDLPRTPVANTMLQKRTSFLNGFLAITRFAMALYLGLGRIKTVFASRTSMVKLLLVAAVNIALVALAARNPDHEPDDPDTETKLLPDPRDVAVTGLYYLLPISALVWNFLVNRLSPWF
ncbi:MAG: TRAP transporter large permease subunit [Rhodobacteraceae bacterium]|nr:TRAP transporter large permease subunit [Paracoccaceae bacterium]